jgi:hypothetical protein
MHDIDEGTLVLETLVVVPFIGSSDKHKFKRVTLASFNCVSFTEAQGLRDKFLELNHTTIKPEYVNGTWTVRKYL